ncbi:MAG: FUSC family protein, partial [Gammaproteobacteria bacterium]
MLSRKTKESIKVALAMTIAYGISLSQDWDRPYWAGFAVAFVSLASIGQSMNKAALRMFGTLMAMVVALTFIALFAQERWAFILTLSVYAGFCCYMMSGSKHAYFWQVSCFVVLVICFDAGPDPVNAFDTAMLRAQQTGLGILVYSLVAIFLWPSRSINVFNAAATELARTQNQFYQACLGLAHGQGDVPEVRRLSALGVQAKTRFDQLLDAAEIDSTDVWELRRPWRRYQQQQMELMQALERWRESLAEVEALHLLQLLPKLETFGAELDGRLAQIAQMLDDHAPQRMPQIEELSFDKDALGRLSHFHRATVVVARSNMLLLEQLTRSLFETVSELKGYGTTTVTADSPGRPAALFLPDLDRLANTIRYMAIIWMAWLALIYVNDLPGGTGLVSFAGSLGIAIANMPQLPVSKLVGPATGGVLFAGMLYIFVMPTLSSFIGLGLMIFAATFAITYLYSEPRQMLGRALGLAMFVVIASISNEQSYNFLSVANTAMMFPLIFLVYATTAYLPWSPRPERRFVRLLGRYFRSSEYLMSAMRWDPDRELTRLERWKK